MRASILASIFLTIAAWSPSSSAWSRRGHGLIAAAAGTVLVKENAIFRERSFDFEYYANVPDIVWKGDDAIYPIERIEHFMDLEIFERETKTKNIPFKDSRAEFFSLFPKIKPEAGRAYWRVHELSSQLSATTEDLKQSDLKDKKFHNDKQIRWLTIAGVMAHYVGDLSMPLHLSENYDGQLSNQKGIHGFFEGDVVDELYPGIVNELHKRVQNLWPAFHKANQKMSVFELMVKLGQNSFAKKDELLDIDKSKGRDLKKVAPYYKDLILDRLTQSSLYLAEIWSRQLGWKFNSEKFFNFEPKPAYIEPNKVLNVSTDKTH